MNTVLRLAAALALVQPPPAPLDNPPAPLAATDWPLDRVTLVNKAEFAGLILSESNDGVKLQIVSRRPGRATMTMVMTFAPKEVARVARLPAPEREALIAKLALLDSGGDGERREMAAVPLAPAPWPGGGPALAYRSERFALTSNASEEVTRRAAVRLEQSFAAYERVLPPRRGAADPVQVLLAGTAADYRAALGAPEADVRNPAVYDPARNRIVCGSDLGGLSAKLAEVRAGHQKERGKLDAAEAELRRLYRGAELDRFVAQIGAERTRLKRADLDNDAAFDRASRQLFTLLVHEAFHAYVATAVYPPKSAPGELPRWLNEGLAQIFETALLEAGEWRVGHLDRARLERVQAKPKPGEATRLPLETLLRSGGRLFVATHLSDQAASDRAYLAAWSLTFYLTFVERRVGTPEFDAYLAALDSGADSVTAFEAWVGKPLTEFEAGYAEYWARVRPDGGVAKGP